VKDVWKTIFVCGIVLFGSAFAIMSFNVDVGVEDLFQKLYLIIAGKEHEGFGVLEGGYGIGVALGIVVFFNHFGGKKSKGEPTPIELKMQQYTEEVDDYMESRKAKNED
jgi:stage V sporulation protein AA